MPELHIHSKPLNGLARSVVGGLLGLAGICALVSNLAIQRTRPSSQDDASLLGLIALWLIGSGWLFFVGIKRLFDCSPKLVLTADGLRDRRTGACFRWSEFREVRLESVSSNGSLVKVTMFVMIWQGQPTELVFDVLNLDRSPESIAFAVQERGLASLSGSTPPNWDVYPNLDLIKQAIRLLHQKLPRDRIQTLSQSLPPKTTKISPDQDIVIGVQHLAGAIVRHLGLPSASVIVVFREMEGPAFIELSSDDDCLVTLNERYRTDHRDIAAILAHEITHLFLDRQRVRLEDTFANEVLTDTAAIYLGIGWPVLNALCLNDEHGGTRIKRDRQQLGYLTSDEFGYVLAKRLLFFNENIDRFVTSPVGKVALANGYRLARLDYRSPPMIDCGLPRRLWYCLNRRRHRSAEKNAVKIGHFWQPGGYEFDEDRVVFECPVCNQKLRLPLAVRATARCRVCESSFDCQT